MSVSASAAPIPPEDLIQSGQYVEAITFCNKALEGKILPRPYRGWLLIERAAAFQGLRDYARAIADLDKALPLFGSDERSKLMVYKGKADVYFAWKKKPEAVEFYSKMLDQKSLPPPRALMQILRTRAGLYNELKKFDLAIQDIDRALKVAARCERCLIKAEIANAKTEEVKLMYLRAQVNASRGARQESERDRAAADKLTEDM
jgi:tetratricopeptide (TPR) repeat protein